MLVLSNHTFLKNRVQCKTVISHVFFSMFLVYHLKNYITSIVINAPMDQYLCAFIQIPPAVFLNHIPFKRYIQTVKETIGVGVNEKAALSSDKNCPFVYINFDFTLVNKVASL